MKRILTILAALAFSACCISCDKYSNTIPGWPWHDPDEDDGEWTDISADYRGLPSYVKILRSPDWLQGKKAIAYIAVVDMNQCNDMNVWGINTPTLQGTDEALKTPMQCYQEKGNPAVVINGGYFYSEGGMNYSSSLEISEGTLLSPNINYASEDWKTMYYPTRGVFLQKGKADFVTGWTYWTDESTPHYFYSQPAENYWGSTPLQVPDAQFPTIATEVSARNGIGAGPVLVKGGEIVATYRQELFNGDVSGILCNTRHPRTAIGFTADKHLVMFVCEGRQMTKGVDGFTLDELANIMKGLGCTEALNLDGGGSSCMIVMGKETIKPSDGEERPVGSCIYIK